MKSDLNKTLKYELPTKECVDYMATYKSEGESDFQDRVLSKFDIEKHAKSSLLIKLCLLFIKKKYTTDRIEKITTVYKIFRGKLYILDQYIWVKVI